MTRETLERILSQSPGVSRDGDSYGIAAEHRASLYLATAGQLSSLSEVHTIRIDGDIVIAETRDFTHHFVQLALVQGFSIRPPRQTASGRTGF